LDYKVSYKNSVSKDLKKIDKKSCLILLDKIEKTLYKNPKIGKELSGNYSGLFSYRVGDYRIIYTIISDYEILILRIAHRKDVYDKL